ncbi:MAG: hypothetical protein NTV94_13545 [Planctomycetota bacterium]|nr:hypothetical protein [Planctomycetota bacterium]
MNARTMRAMCGLCLLGSLVLWAPVNQGGVGFVSEAGAGQASPEDVRQLFVQALPAGALELSEAIASAKPGETITFRGYVGAGPDAFAKDGAGLQLVAAPASKDPIVTVRFATKEGTPLVAAVSGKFGLKAGAEVFVTGKVEATTPGLTVVASSVHVPRSSMPETIFATKVPEKVRDVSEARKDSAALKVGDEVVLRGRIGGSKEPFVAGRAITTLVGRGLKACSDHADDKCTVPWDYCCETKQDITANSATIQIVDAKGQVLRTDLKGRRGIKELSEVVVIGKVAVADAKALVINATSIVVEH